MHKRLISLALLVASAATSGTANGGDVTPSRYVLKAARVYTGREVFEPGAVLVVNGKIAAVGESVTAPPGTEVEDLGSAVLMPGLVLASTSLGGRASGDESVAAHYHAGEGFDPFRDHTSALLGGVTSVYLSPGDDRVISGHGAVAKLGGADHRGELVKEWCALEINLGQSSLNPPRKLEIPIPPSSDNPIMPAIAQLPTTRLGQLMAVHEAFAAAKSGGDTAELKALAEAMAGKRLLRIHASEAPDILRALQLAGELGHPAVLTGVIEIAEVKGELLAAGLPLIAELGLSLGQPGVEAPVPTQGRGGRGLNSPGPPAASPAASLPQLADFDSEVAVALMAKGIAVAITPPPGGSLADAMTSGALLLRGGASRADAVAAMTRVPAELLGVADRLGALAPGRDADILVLSGEPFTRAGHVQRTYVSGRLVARRDGGEQAHATVIRAGRLHVGDGTVLNDAAIVLVDGKVQAVGHDVAIPPGARVVDAGDDAVITPGFLDANSHLELGGDRTGFGLDADLTRLVAAADEAALMVARGGVTTALVQPYGGSLNGARVVAVKTAGDDRATRVVDDLAGIRMNWSDNADPQTTADQLAGRLKAGKAYHDQWLKYFEALKKWEEEQAKKAKEARPTPPPKPAEEETEDEVVTEKKADPITGTWEIEVSGGPIPEPQTGEMILKLEGTKVTGTFGALFGGPDGDAPEFEGTFENGTLRAELDIGAPFPVTLECQVANDSMQGTLAFGDQFTFDISGKRTEKEVKETTTVVTRKKKEADGRPAAPDVNPAQEPFRRLFAGDIPLILDINAPVAMLFAVRQVVDEFKVELVLMGAGGLHRVQDQVAGKIQGVVLPTRVLTRRSGVPGDIVPGAEVADMGLRAAFQSDGATAGRGLGLNAAYAVNQGMDPTAAIKALTSDAATLFHVNDRVGALKAGLDADVLVFSGDPFELSSTLLHVFVDGEEIEQEVNQ